MPKRKSDPCSLSTPISLTSLDAAFDILACETFTRLHHCSQKFEAAAGVKLSEGVIRARWDEAVRRYWVMKGMNDLCCGSKIQESGGDSIEEEVKMEEISERNIDGLGRPLPSKVHPGAVVIHSLDPVEELEWRRWQPKTGDVVLVELSDGEIWPGKIIDKKTFFQGRTQPRGNHFFAIRVYSEDIQPTVTVKSRLIPMHFRSNPPLLASTDILGAYNHASNPTSFDMRASARESLAAHSRTHPGVGSEDDHIKIKKEKASWNELMNWVMSERRVEKIRAVAEERTKRLREVSKEDILEGTGEAGCSGNEIVCLKKRRPNVPLPPTHGAGSQLNSIFGVVKSPTGPPRAASPSSAGFIRPALSSPQIPNSPRRLSDKRRSVYSGMGQYSPRGRGGTYTPPRILPSGDETAPSASGSPAPTLQHFDFISPLGPVRTGRLDTDSPNLGRKGSLEAVKEEPSEEGDGWTLVYNRRPKRAGSLPCRKKASTIIESAHGPEGMTVDV